MNKRNKKKYQKEVEELSKRYLELKNYHNSRLDLKFVNDVWKLWSKYFGEEAEK